MLALCLGVVIYDEATHAQGVGIEASKPQPRQFSCQGVSGTYYHIREKNNVARRGFEVFTSRR